MRRKPINSEITYQGVVVFNNLLVYYDVSMVGCSFSRTIDLLKFICAVICPKK